MWNYSSRYCHWLPSCEGKSSTAVRIIPQSSDWCENRSSNYLNLDWGSDFICRCVDAQDTSTTWACHGNLWPSPALAYSVYDSFMCNCMLSAVLGLLVVTVLLLALHLFFPEVSRSCLHTLLSKGLTVDLLQFQVTLKFLIMFCTVAIWLKHGIEWQCMPTCDMAFWILC